MTMEMFPECELCNSFFVIGRVIDGNATCACRKHLVEIPAGLTAKRLICLDYVSKWTSSDPVDRARDWHYEPMKEGVLYSYESGYNFRESFRAVCRIDELPKWDPERTEPTSHPPT